MKDKVYWKPLIREMREWLGVLGLNFFLDTKHKYGRIDAVWMEDGIPHMVHFREGMDVRNKLRELTNNEWTAIEYDETWVAVIEECIK